MKKGINSILKNFNRYQQRLDAATLNSYLDYCKTNKVGDFFTKRENLVRLSKSDHGRIYRCSRWVEEETVVIPEWWSAVSQYRATSGFFYSDLKIYLSVFDTKSQENLDKMYKLRSQFDYRITGSAYGKRVKTYYDVLMDLYTSDSMFHGKLDMVRSRERNKFQQIGNLMMHFAELSAAVQESSERGAALFIHDTQRVSVVRHLERVELIPKIGYLPIIRKSVLA